MQQRLQRFIGGCGYLDEDRLTVGAPVHAVQHQAVKVNVEVGGRAKALDQRDRAAVGLLAARTRARPLLPLVSYDTWLCPSSPHPVRICKCSIAQSSPANSPARAADRRHSAEKIRSTSAARLRTCAR